MVSYASTLSRMLLVAAAGLTLLHAGCEGLRKHRHRDGKTPPEPGTAATQVVATWKKKVQFGTDPVTNSTIAALSGRVYLFDPTGGYPVEGDGKLSVDLYDDTQKGTGAPAKMIEQWNLGPDQIKQLAQKDALGSGYTLALPWSTYKPDISQIHMVVKYEPKTGTPLTTSSQVITVEHDLPPAVVKKTISDPKILQASATK